MLVIEWYERVQRMCQFSFVVLASRSRSALIFLYSVRDLKTFSSVRSSFNKKKLIQIFLMRVAFSLHSLRYSVSEEMSCSRKFVVVRKKGRNKSDSRCRGTSETKLNQYSRKWNSFNIRFPTFYRNTKT